MLSIKSTFDFSVAGAPPGIDPKLSTVTVGGVTMNTDGVSGKFDVTVTVEDNPKPPTLVITVVPDVPVAPPTPSVPVPPATLALSSEHAPINLNIVSPGHI